MSAPERRARWIDSPMEEPWHRDLVAGTTARESGGLTAWAERVALTYSRSGTLEITAVIWALLDSLDESEARAEMRSRGHARALGRIQRIREAHDWQCDCSEDDPCRIRAAIDTTEETR